MTPWAALGRGRRTQAESPRRESLGTGARVPKQTKRIMFVARAEGHGAPERRHRQISNLAAGYENQMALDKSACARSETSADRHGW